MISKGLKKIVLITGIRPNIVKAFSLYRNLLEEECFVPILIHTNQHSGDEMFKILWNEFGLPKPKLLEYQSSNEADRLGYIIVELSKQFRKIRPDLVIVFGDGDSTLAGALTASKMKIPLAHVEAGLRSFDWGMPEEHNRVTTDHLSDFLFITEYSGLQNLTFEQVSQDKIFLVGNTMIDALVVLRDKFREKNKEFKRFPYYLFTIHRPSNVDNPERFKRILKFLEKLKHPILFPVHPRARKAIQKFNLEKYVPKNLYLIKPFGYLDFLSFEEKALAVITDSGGVQEETTYLGVPCLTIRSNTERPITIETGSNTLILDEMETVGEDHDLELFERSSNKKGKVPNLWDGEAGKRIVKILRKEL